MRPSTGWGTIAQIRDLTLAARAFYGLADHTHNPGLTDIDGWEQMSVAQAAQAVERSAFPDAYAEMGDRRASDRRQARRPCRRHRHRRRLR